MSFGSVNMTTQPASQQPKRSADGSVEARDNKHLRQSRRPSTRLLPPSMPTTLLTAASAAASADRSLSRTVGGAFGICQTPPVWSTLLLQRTSLLSMSLLAVVLFRMVPRAIPSEFKTLTHRHGSAFGMVKPPNFFNPWTIPS